MNSCIHARSLCLESLLMIFVSSFGNVRWVRAGLMSKTDAWTSWSNIHFRSVAVGWQVWLSDSCLTLFVLSYWLCIDWSLPRQFPTRFTELLVTLAPSPLIKYLHTLFRCSICKSAAMFLPARPWTFIVLLHLICIDILGQKGISSEPAVWMLQ